MARVTADVRGSLAAEQLALLDDPNRWKVACAARQSGKTFVGARLMVLTAISGPDRIVVYVSDTWHNARKAMWDDQVDGIPAVLNTLGFRGTGRDPDYRINLSSLTVTFRNGSFIELAGADRGAWAKFRGRKIDLLVADEMQRQDQEHLERALDGDVRDCLMARHGSFVGLGTVGRALAGIWYRLNCQTPPGWTAHTWTAEQLQHLTDVWAEQLRTAAAFGVDVDTDPTFLRERRAMWVRDDENLLHRLTESSLWDGGVPPSLIRTRCPEHGMLSRWEPCVCELPLVPRTRETLVFAGFDWGGGTSKDAKDGDPCAVCVVSVSGEEGIIRELHSEQKYCPDGDVVAAWLRDVRAKHGVRTFYSDPTWTLNAHDMVRLHGLPFEPAVKGNAEGTDEDFWHGQRAAALRRGTMLVRRNSILHDQLETLLRDPKEMERGHIRTGPGQDDHVADCWRYVFRMVRTRHVRVPEPPVPEDDRRERELLGMALRRVAPSNGDPRGRRGR